MKIDGWKYYNHAAIPTTAPHETINDNPIKEGVVWKMDCKPLLVRWTTDWDCGYETQWWYCIKDTPFDISLLKSKRRYEINKGSKNFSIKKIEPENMFDDLYRVTLAAYSGWPEKYRPQIDESGFRERIESWKDSDVFGGFDSDNRMRGFAVLNDYKSYVEFSVLRTEPETEKLAINAAMVAGILNHYNNRFDGKFYINDGSRAIRHETAFQDYLEKYFDFRKAYCRLNVKYKVWFRAIVKLLYPFRSVIKSNTKFGSLLSGILKMEEIRRSF